MAGRASVSGRVRRRTAVQLKVGDFLTEGGRTGKQPAIHVRQRELSELDVVDAQPFQQGDRGSQAKCRVRVTVFEVGRLRVRRRARCRIRDLPLGETQVRDHHLKIHENQEYALQFERGCVMT